MLCRDLPKFGTQTRVPTKRVVQEALRYVLLLLAHLREQISLWVSLLQHAGCWPSLTFDHADIIGTVSNCQGHSLLVLLHQLHYLGLLQGSHPAADHHFAHAGSSHQLQLQVPFQCVSLERRKGSVQGRLAAIPGMTKRVQQGGHDSWARLWHWCEWILPSSIHTAHHAMHPTPTSLDFECTTAGYAPQLGMNNSCSGWCNLTEGRSVKHQEQEAAAGPETTLRISMWESLCSSLLGYYLISGR